MYFFLLLTIFFFLFEVHADASWNNIALAIIYLFSCTEDDVKRQRVEMLNYIVD